MELKQIRKFSSRVQEIKLEKSELKPWETLNTRIGIVEAQEEEEEKEDSGHILGPLDACFRDQKISCRLFEPGKEMEEGMP